ncbi:hypothetical protein [uncultured Desulfuromusa sp.]|uniref:hypothetical protein n=1 Tax=uncultured Desulfuromusa sp. TaxID=219183 RepID=UPI002AA90179|nr:hypothetical protein [uncultured Desulfuromusa sp.]
MLFNYKEKRTTILSFALGLTLILFCFIKIIGGYWPFPEIMRKIYYQNKHEKNKINSIVLDRAFKFNCTGYEKKYILRSNYPLAHNLNIIFRDRSHKLSDLAGLKIKVEIFDSNNKLYSGISSDLMPLYINENFGKNMFLYGVNIIQIPFNFNGRLFRGTNLTLTVLSSPIGSDICQDEAELHLFPNISIE